MEKFYEVIAAFLEMKAHDGLKDYDARSVRLDDGSCRFVLNGRPIALVCEDTEGRFVMLNTGTTLQEVQDVLNDIARLAEDRSVEVIRI